MPPLSGREGGGLISGLKYEFRGGSFVAANSNRNIPVNVYYGMIVYLKLSGTEISAAIDWPQLKSLAERFAITRDNGINIEQRAKLAGSAYRDCVVMNSELLERIVVLVKLHSGSLKFDKFDDKLSLECHKRDYQPQGNHLSAT